MKGKNKFKLFFIFLCSINIFMLLNYSQKAHAIIYFSENWDTGTPATCWPCKSYPCTNSFDGWLSADYNSSWVTMPNCGRNSTQAHSGTYSYYQYRASGAPQTCDIFHGFTTPYPTTIYIRFYLYLTTNWNNFGSLEFVHWIMTNIIATNTSFRLNFVGDGQYNCGDGGIHMIPEGDGGRNWWFGNSNWDVCRVNYKELIGAWHSIEYKMEISGSNIILTEWIDGVLRRGPTTGPGQDSANNFNKITISGWENTSSAHVGDFYIDDIVVSDSYIGSGGGDTQAPSVPAGLSAQAVSSSQINLSWTASTDNVGVTGYRVYRNGTQIDTSPTNSYSNTGLSASTTYAYSVSAYDAAINVSAQSASASATTASDTGGNTGGSGGDGSASGGSGCGFVKDDGKRQGAKGEGVSMILLFLLLIFILLSRARYRRLLMRKLSIFFLAGMFLFLNASISLAAVSLPWSTTYNCPEWTWNGALPLPNCDGISNDAGGTCSNNGDKTEQITAVANYSGGVGGKGQRHWMGDGVNNVSGGLYLSFTSPQSEIWIRWYMRYEQGFQWAELVNQKILYFDPVSFPRLIVEYYGQDKVQIYSYAVNQGWPSVGNGWNVIMANGGTDANGNKTSDGQWHLWEFHVKIDTNGSNGILELWVDQKKVINVNNANLAAAPLSNVLIGSNGFTPGNGRCNDIAISNTGPIGPIGGDTGGNNGSSGGDTSASGGSGCGIIKGSDGKGTGSGPKVIDIGIASLLLLLLFYKLMKLYKISFWIVIVFFIITITIANNIEAATLEVGSGKTYSTIQSAVDTAQSGDTVLVYPGTYTQSTQFDFAGASHKTLVLVNKSGTSSSSPFTVKAAGSGVILDGASDTGIQNCFWGRDRAYVVIDGFECRNINVEASNVQTGAIYFQNSNHLLIQNNTLYNITQTDYENKPVILLLSDPDSTIRNNTIKANSIGIGIGYSLRVTIEGNTIDGSGTANGMYVSERCDDMIITGNYIYNYGWAGVQLRDSERLIITKNIVYNAHPVGNMPDTFGFYFRDWPTTPSSGVAQNEQYQVYNNIVDTATGGFVFAWQDGDVLKNNITINVKYAVWDYSNDKDSSDIIIEYNIFNYSVTWLRQDGPAPTYSDNNMTYTEKNNLWNIDPKFVATGARPYPYYTLQSSSPAIDAGAPDTPTGTDFIGTAVPQGAAADIGAFEYCPSGNCSTSGGGNTGSSGGDSSSSGGSGCGFVKDINSKGQGAKSEGVTLMILLIITLAGISLAKRVLDISIK